MLTSNGYVLDEHPDRLGRLEPVPASERSSRTDLLGRLDRDGYLYLRGFLDPMIVEAFRDYYFAALQPSGLDQRQRHDVPLDKGLLRQILFADIVPGRAYAALCRHPVIEGWFTWLFEEDVHLHRRKIIRHVRPGEVGVGLATQAHYDLVYLREGTDRVLSMWIPLGDCPRERGGLIYLEGSHHHVRREEADGTLRRPAASITADLPKLADDLDARWLCADYRAGDVVVHCSQIIHAALDNVDAENMVRLSTDIRYQRSSEGIDQRWQQHWIDTDGL
ncbi:MAG TPA: phytanoyl-CoA dioxygenase family protein [Microlunatus sp.]|nr:phytanoyl-CoA dioxygenase family protein [Microlunatus sp.]